VNTPLGLSPTPLMVSMEQSLAEWMQMGNQLLDKPHHESPRGLKFDLVAETPLVMIMFNALSGRFTSAILRRRSKYATGTMIRWMPLFAVKWILALPGAKVIRVRANC
jgi:hypothetical protein